MKTLIISSSLSENSKSYILCQKVNTELLKKGIKSEIVDARLVKLLPFHVTKSKEMEELSNKISKSDNYIIGMGIHNYSISDSLKIILDNCFTNVDGKFFGIVCAAGGEKSYLSTIHLSQICMSQWKMIQLPRIIYASKNDFDKNKIISKNVLEWIDIFCAEFIEIGKKLKI